MSIKLPSLFFRTEPEQKKPGDKTIAIQDGIVADLRSVSNGLENMATNKFIEADALGCARFVSRAYQIRREYLPKELDRLGEPAWTILVETFIGDETGKTVSVSDIAHISRLPSKTTLRYINLLVDCGMLVALAEQSDNQNNNLKLSESGHTLVSQTLSRISDSNI